MVIRRLASLLVVAGVVTAAGGQAPFEPTQGTVDVPTFPKNSSREQNGTTQHHNGDQQRVPRSQKLS